MRLCWKSMRLIDIDVPDGCVERGEMHRLVMPRRYQFAWLNSMLAAGKCVWIDSDAGELSCASDGFTRKVGCVLHQRSMLANLSLRENILLPFLYRGPESELQRAEGELPGIAERLDIKARLDEQAGERSAYMHGVVALARAWLLRPDFIVAQDPHSGMQPHREALFRRHFCELIEALQAGVLYLTASQQDVSGLDFCRSMQLAGAEESV